MQAVQTQPILVVDDDSHMRAALTEAISRLGYQAVVCDNGEDAIARLHRTRFGMVVTDMKMPKMDGLTFLKEVRRRNSALPVLVITGFGTVENAVESMKEGAVDYLMKPFSFDALKNRLESILARDTADREILAVNEEMRKVLLLAGNLAGSDITVLICGESGTGKELLARHIHRASRRKDGPFVGVNCAAIPETLLESELFGHEKGAFTGAVDRKIGLFERATGGTILLDEIGEMPLALQAKLLRVLQEREIDRVGGKGPIAIDARVIATTNRDLARECREGRFREDLYYRLNVFPLKVPPLRERPEDVEELAVHFIRTFGAEAGKTVEGIAPDAAALLRARPWRGNVRELQNTMHRAVFMCPGGTITADHLMFDDNGASGDAADRPAPAGTIRDMERDMILRTLQDAKGNKAQAARVLGVSVRTIRNKLAEYGKNFPDE